jgi:sulfur-oxidizing protein SoxA
MSPIRRSATAGAASCRRALRALFLAIVPLCGPNPAVAAGPLDAAQPPPADAAGLPVRIIPLDELRSGASFAPQGVRALQEDDFANPGMLWVDRGRALWDAPAGPGGRSCASCHGAVESGMRGVATRYPRYDTALARLVNLPGRINACRTAQQGAPAFAKESEPLLALTALVAMQSRGLPMAVSIEGPARPHFEAGRALYYRRMGQVNLACSHCHEQNWGKRLYAETISQGHGVAYPIYRLDWQTMGSLHRRFRACLSGVRAEMWPYGAPEYLDLELFVAWRAQGLPIETPGVRK